MNTIILSVIITFISCRALCQNPINEIYKNDKDGLYEDHYLTGQLMCRCTLKDGNIVSKRECFYKDGKPWVVEEFSNGKFNGRCFLLNENQDTVYIEQYANDTLLNTRNFHYYKSGKLKTKRIITYLNEDLPTGKKPVSSKRVFGGIRTTPKEKELSPNFGTEIRYYETGEVSDSLPIQKGLYNGEAESFYPSGKRKSVSHYKDDELDGLFIEYDEKGTEIKRTAYSKGKKAG
jgi:antitoxin component YwqK of YwqJK toxin-antitoxin module